MHFCFSLFSLKKQEKYLNSPIVPFYSFYWLICQLVTYLFLAKSFNELIYIHIHKGSVMLSKLAKCIHTTNIYKMDNQVSTA